MISRSIAGVSKIPSHRHGASLVTWNVGEELIGSDADPFIVVSLYDMTGPTFAPHPHAGFAVATYILPESPIGFVNQDSLGTRNRIAPGALHLTVAGSGALHEEQPETTGSVARGFQIWMDFANGTRQAPPRVISLAAEAVPERMIGGARVRAIIGESNGLASRVELPTKLRIIDVALQPGASFTQKLIREENAFLFVHDGAIESAGQTASAGEVVRTARDGTRITVSALDRGGRFTLFAGMPLNQPRAQSGPMVASDAAELAQFMNAYTAGRFGSLIPFAQNPF